MRTALLTIATIAILVGLALGWPANTPQTSPAALPSLTGMPVSRAVELVTSLDRTPIVQERAAVFGLPRVVVSQAPPAGTPLDQVLEVLLITTADATP